MTSTDFIALFAVLAGIAATIVSIVGWRENRDTLKEVASEQAKAAVDVNKQLEEMKEEFARAREARQLILPDRLADLKTIDNWFDEGLRLGRVFASLAVSRDQSNQEWWIERHSKALEQRAVWSEQHYRCHALLTRFGAPKFPVYLQMHGADGRPLTEDDLFSAMAAMVIIFDIVVENAQVVMPQALQNLETIFKAAAEYTEHIRTNLIVQTGQLPPTRVS